MSENRKLPLGASPRTTMEAEGFAGPNHAVARALDEDIASQFSACASIEKASPFDSLGVSSAAPVYKGIASMKPAHAMARAVPFAPLERAHMSTEPLEKVKITTSGFGTSPLSKTLIGFGDEEEPAACGDGPLRASPEPFHVSPYTHFRVKGEVCDIVAALESTVAGMGGDISFFQRDGCRWKVLLYDVCKKLEVRTQLYEYPNSISSGESLYTFEAQKVSGCAYQFSSFYRSIREGMVRAGVACDDMGHTMTLKDLPSSPEGRRNIRRALPGRVKPCEATFAPLLEMIRSNYFDVQLQGMEIIAQKAAVCDSSMAVLREMPGVISLMVDCAKNGDADLRRCAATVLRCFGRIEKCRGVISKCGGVANLVSILTNERSSLEEKRQTTRALKNLSTCPRLAAELKKFNVLGLFEKLEEGEADERLKQCCREAREALLLHKK